jgi:hypothetical protein
MKKILILLVSLAFNVTLVAQLQKISLDLAKEGVKSDGEYILPDADSTAFYVFFQKDNGTFSEGKITLIKVDTGSKILIKKVLPKTFPGVSTFLKSSAGDKGLEIIYRANKKAGSSKMEGIQVVKSLHIDKTTLEQTETSLFEINYPKEEILTFIERDTVNYLMTFENKANKVHFYAFNNNILLFQKTISLKDAAGKTFYKDVFTDLAEGKDFATSSSKCKIFLQDSIFHCLIDHESNQFYASFDLSKDSISIEKMPLALHSAVFITGNGEVDRETTGQVVGDKIFQLHRIQDLLCLGVYDLKSFKRLAIYEFKKGDLTIVKNSPYYLDNQIINKKDEAKNNKAFFKQLILNKLAIEVVDSNDVYQLKLGAVNFALAINNSPWNNNMWFMQQHRDFMMQQTNYQNIIKNAPPSMSSGGFRSILQPLPTIEEPIMEAYFYLKLNKSDLSIAKGDIVPPISPLSIFLKGRDDDKKVFFKVKNKKGVGYYTTDFYDKKFVIKFEK